MNTPQIPPSTGRGIIQGQPVSVFHFGSPITPPVETGYSYVPGTVLTSVNQKPPAIGVAGVSSPRQGSNIFAIPPAGAVGVAYNGQGNGVPTGITGGAVPLQPPVAGGIFSTGPARAIGVGYLPVGGSQPPTVPVQGGGPIARVFMGLFS